MKVVLYDTDTRRVWVVDGASVLLRIILAHLSTERYWDRPILPAIYWADPNNGLQAARLTLCDPNKQEITLQETVETSQRMEDAAVVEEKTIHKWTFKDMDTNTFSILEQLHDAQCKLLAEGNQKYTTVHQLSSFDFMDIVGEAHVIRPRVATLISSGLGWIDFARRIDAS
jgi:hypothetical protein